MSVFTQHLIRFVQQFPLFQAIGNHPLIKRFCKGISIIKPQTFRYDYIWDPAPMIAKLATIFPYHSLPLETSTKK